MMIGLRPMRSDSQPNTMKNGVPMISEPAISAFASGVLPGRGTTTATTAFAIVASTGNMYNGLWYPIIIAGITLVIGTLFIRETKDVDIYAND